MDGLCVATIPQLLPAAFQCRLAAQYLLSELRARFPRINGISVTGGSGNGDLKLHRIQVGPWNGILPRDGDAAATEDRLSSADLGSMTGKLESITEKEVTFSQKSAPKSPGLFIHLPRESKPPFDAVARVSLGAVGQLGVASLEIRDGVAHLHTAFAEDLELPAAALDAISPFLARSSCRDQGRLSRFQKMEMNSPARWSPPPTTRHSAGSLSGGQELAIELKNLEGIRLADPAPSSEPRDSAYVELTNGDRLRGGVVSFDEHQLGFGEPLLGSVSVGALPRSETLFPKPARKFATAATTRKAGSPQTASHRHSAPFQA